VLWVENAPISRFEVLLNERSFGLVHFDAYVAALLDAVKMPAVYSTDQLCSYFVVLESWILLSALEYKKSLSGW